MRNTKYYVPSGQIPRRDVVHASLFHFGQIMTNNSNSKPYMSNVIIRGNVEKTRLTLYELCKVRRNVKKTRLIQHSTHVRKNVYKRRLVNYKRIIRFELTKVRRNVEKSYQTRWLQMHYNREKHCQRTKIQTLIKYATTNSRKNVFRLN